MALLFYVNRHRLRNERIFRDRLNPLDTMTDDELISRYRLPRQEIVQLCATLEADLEHETGRNFALPSSLQVMTALRFYAVGGFQTVIGDLHGLHKSTVSRCIRKVSAMLAAHTGDFIKFPSSAEHQRRNVTQFYDMCGMPRVLGAVDGTLIPIAGPKEDEHLFVCRKGYHAINCQVVVDADLQFLDVVVRYPGSAHDSFIWNNCRLAERFRNGDFGRNWLLGDSGYLYFLYTCIYRIPA